jgi:hypothetical protein
MEIGKKRPQLPLQNAYKEYCHDLAIHNIGEEQKALSLNNMMNVLVPVDKTVIS